MTRMLVFSGGRGCRNLFASMASRKGQTFEKVSIVINGLDDGASTGQIRNDFEWKAHGISDFLKVICALSSDFEAVNQFEQRISKASDTKGQIVLLEHLFKFINQKDELNILDIGFTKAVAGDLKESLSGYIDYVAKTKGAIPDLQDFKVGNIIFAASVIKNNFNFSKAIIDISEKLNLDNEVFEVLEASERSACLVGLNKNGLLLPNEASIVTSRVNDEIEDIFQIEGPLSANEIRSISSLDKDEKKRFLYQRQIYPEANTAVIRAISVSEHIVYGAGTPFSSLFPSLECLGVPEALAKSEAKKTLVMNLTKETSNTIFASDLLELFFYYLQKSNRNISPEKLLDSVVLSEEKVNNPYPESDIICDCDELKRKFPWVSLEIAPLIKEGTKSHHCGDKLLEVLVG